LVEPLAEAAMTGMTLPKDMPFELKRMVYGGFKVAVGD
jgi:uncharacterized protein YbaA (DUF1428 family)